MKKILKKISLMLIVLCSLFTMIVTSNNSVFALEDSEVIQERIELDSIQREENKITFKTKEKIIIENITYEISYLNNGEKYGQLIQDANVSKIDDYTYSFDISDEIIGVKIWKIRKFVSEGYFKNKFTSGNNVVGDMESIYKKNYIEVTTDKLEYKTTCEAVNLFGSIFKSNEECVTIYVFYFNLDTQVDEIIDITFEYSIKVQEKKLFGNAKEYVKSKMNIEVDHEEVTWRLNGFDDLVNDIGGAKELNKLYNELGDDGYRQYMIDNGYTVPALGRNTGNEYDWYLYPLTNQEVALEESEDFWGMSYYKEYLQEVAIVKMNYYTSGEYYDDIPVLDEDSGEIIVVQEPNIFKKAFDTIVNFFKENTWVFWVLVILLVYPIIQLVISLIVALFKLIMIPINIIIGIFSGINESSKRRRNKRREKRLREEEMYRYEENRRRNERYIENRQYDDKKMRKYRNYK